MNLFKIILEGSGRNIAETQQLRSTCKATQRSSHTETKHDIKPQVYSTPTLPKAKTHAITNQSQNPYAHLPIAGERFPLCLICGFEMVLRRVSLGFGDRMQETTFTSCTKSIGSPFQLQERIRQVQNLQHQVGGILPKQPEQLGRLLMECLWPVFDAS